MNKQELESANTEKAINPFVETTKETLSKKESIHSISFVTSSVSKRFARTGRDPQTGKEIQIAAKNVAKFKAGKALTRNII